MKTRILICLIALMLLVGCADNSTQSKEQNFSEQQQTKLFTNQPPPTFDYSLERENLIKRDKLENDANKVSYIYLLSDTGQIYTFLTVKGKVSSVNSLLTTPEQIKCPYSGSCLTTESPQEDGSYGTNGDAIFFFTTEDVYVEWNGKYLLVDQPLQLTSRPVLIYDAAKDK